MATATKETAVKGHLQTISKEESITSHGDILTNIHALLLALGTTFASLIFKTLPAFIPFIMVDYGFSYQFTASALAFGSLITATAFITTPLVLHLRTNVVFSIFMLLVWC